MKKKIKIKLVPLCTVERVVSDAQARAELYGWNSTDAEVVYCMICKTLQFPRSISVSNFKIHPM